LREEHPDRAEDVRHLAIEDGRIRTDRAMRPILVHQGV